jgi:glyoxylase-like metal-dependent hydrolase (beta-lactamase superfamily II)
VTLTHGGWEIEPLDCGSLDFPAAALGPGFDDPTARPVLATLWRGHGRIALVDSGAGAFDELWPGAAGLTGALERAAVGADDLTEIVLTHLDFDHSGGVVAGTLPDALAPAFGSTPVRVFDVDLDFWASDVDSPPLRVGPRVLRVLRKAGVLGTFSDQEEVLPGVRARSAPGHCAGHCVLQVDGEDGTLLHLADLIHHPVHVEHPEWDHLNDRRPEVALATRTALLAEAEHRHCTLIASHIEGAGRIERRDGRAVWITVS